MPFSRLAKLLLPVIFILNSSFINSISLVGKWQASRNGNEVVYHFFENGEVEIITKELVLKTDEYTTVNYKVTPSGNFYNLDIIIKAKATPSQEMVIKALVKTTGPDKILMAWSSKKKSERPADFNESNQLIHLKKQF